MSQEHDSLLDRLIRVLSEVRGPKRHVSLFVLRSQPRPCRSLFPWSPVHQSATIQEYLILYTEPVNISITERDDTQVPIFALEASLYRNVGSKKSTQFPPRTFLYISKIDTTGLLSSDDDDKHNKRPSVARKLTSAFIEGMGCDKTFIFARSQSQYLFPGSAKNLGKRVIDDRALASWWSRTIEMVNPSKVCWSLGGYSQIEARQLLSSNIAPFRSLNNPSSSSSSSSLETRIWVYGHPYSDEISIADQIPSFVDDPKSRYMCALASARISPAGEEGDFDEHYESILRNPPSTLKSQREISENDRKRERVRLENVNADEFWEGLGWRQECSDGHVAGFFVVELAESTTTTTTTNHHKQKGSSFIKDDYQMPYSMYLQYWSTLHNTDYGSIEKIKQPFENWKESLKSFVDKNEQEGIWNKMVWRSFETGSYAVGSKEQEQEQEQEEKKKAEEMKMAGKSREEMGNGNGYKRGNDCQNTPVNILAPRKKTKARE